MTAEYPEDSLLDAVALVLAIRNDDMEAARAITDNSDWYGVMLALAKLCVEFLDEEQVSPEWFRKWARQAVNRSSS